MHKLILIIFLFSVGGVFSQSIENVDFRSEGKTIVVTYDYFYPKADTAINVDLVFKDQEGDVVTPKTISGDIKNVKPGESKRIVWDVLSDGISLSGKYKAEVYVSRGGLVLYEKRTLGDSAMPPIVVDIFVEDTKESFEEGNEAFAPPENNGSAVQDNPKDMFETFIDEEAGFPGGYPAMMAWIKKNLVFPETAFENGVQGKCFLRFVVSVNGTISSVQVTKGVPDCSDCDKEAIKAIKSMPNWNPAKLNGRSVSSFCSIPIIFFLEGKPLIIGTQVWNKKNLNVDHFRNGDLIPEAKTAEEWKKAGKKKRPAWCYYENDPSNGDKYGILYNWYAVKDTRGLPPAGWHVPSDEEWTVLSNFLGGKDVAGKKMKSTSGWNDNGNGTNSSGFSGLPGGGRNSSGYFGLVGDNGPWWSASEANGTTAWVRELASSPSSLNRANGYKRNGFSVRCVED